MPARIGIVGSGFVASVHAEALKRVPAAELVAVASPTEEHVRAFARRHAIRHAYTDYRQLLAREDIDLITVACPNYLHRDVTVEAAGAGKHVVCEKPLAMNLGECDEMIEACRAAGVKLMYAEQLASRPSTCGPSNWPTRVPWAASTTCASWNATTAPTLTGSGT